MKFISIMIRNSVWCDANTGMML